MNAAKSQISKSMLAELFNVSRSAITQSTKNKPIGADIRARIIRTLFTRTEATYYWRMDCRSRAKKLLARFREITAARRREYSGKGRPKRAADFTTFRKLLRSVMKQYESWDLATQPDMCRPYGREAIDVLYALNGISQKVWGVLPYIGKEMDYSLDY